MKKNDIIHITITDLAEDGSGIGRHDNMVVFCRGMLPDESGEVRIIKVTKSYCVAKLLKLTSVSSQRIEPPCCENFAKGCGGCTFCHINYEGQLKYKERRVADCIERIGGFDNVAEILKPIIPSENTQHYRNKSIYPFALNEKGVVCGFYAPASHRVIPITSDSKCGLENDLSAEIRRFTTEFANQNKISVYNEETGSGILRALMVRTNRTATEAMTILVLNCKKAPDWADKYASELTEKLPGVISVYLSFNTKNTNVVLSNDMQLVLGKETISDKIGNFEDAPVFEISPLSFYQVNPNQTERLYNAVFDVFPKEIFSKKNCLIYDIYCGIGTIGLYLMSCIKNKNTFLVGVEYVDSAVKNARKNAKSNGFDSNSEFFCGDASLVTPEVLSKYGKPSVIILDPPRKGCDASLIETVLSAGADYIIYVSCNPATLARDTKLLCSESENENDSNINSYVCESIQPVDMFPQSSHVETVVKLVRKKPDAYINITVDMDELDLTVSEAKTTTVPSVKEKIDYCDILGEKRK